MERLSIDEIISDFECDAKENRIDLDISYAEKNEQVAKWLKELKAYRDAEEQGLLLRLPCKVGDKAYYVHKGGIDEVEVDSFVLNINLFVNVSYYIGCDRFGKTLTPYKTLFFTKEEAEQKLASMQKGE